MAPEAINSAPAAEAPYCYSCCRSEGVSTLVAESRPRTFGDPKPLDWFWFDEEQEPPVWRNNLGRHVSTRLAVGPDSPQSRQVVVLYECRDWTWDGEFICELCMAELDYEERLGSTFRRREPAPSEPVGQLELVL